LERRKEIISREKRGKNKSGEKERTMNWREGREYGMQRRKGIGSRDNEGIMDWRESQNRDWTEGRKYGLEGGREYELERNEGLMDWR
jgi:hypothetical protein